MYASQKPKGTGNTAVGSKEKFMIPDQLWVVVFNFMKGLQS